mgnify:CR=1 FL=1
MKLVNYSSLSENLSNRERSLRRNMNPLSAREIFWVPSSSERMMNWPFCTKRSRFNNLLWLRERPNTEKDSMISSILEIKLGTNTELSRSPRSRLTIFLSSRMKSITCRRNLLRKSSRSEVFLMNWRTPWTSIDGESSKEPTLIHTKWSQRSRLCRRDWLQRPKKYYLF